MAALLMDAEREAFHTGGLDSDEELDRGMGSDVQEDIDEIKRNHQA